MNSSTDSKTSFFERLEAACAPARERFSSVPVIRRALDEGVPGELYAAYLGQAYHHVRHTCPLLCAAASRCGRDDAALAEALYEYISEEYGHEAWILDDIRAVAGQAEVDRVTSYEGDPPVRALVGYMYHAIHRYGPYAMLGMVYVLEGMSVLLAQRAASAIRERADAPPAGGFSYLTSHGEVDQDHIAFYRDLVNRVADPQREAVIVDTALMVFDLWGRMFDELGRNWEDARDAA